jgi:DNA-directed RNA polymerase subunit H (RpoH/RPB5)
MGMAKYTMRGGGNPFKWMRKAFKGKSSKANISTGNTVPMQTNPSYIPNPANETKNFNTVMKAAKELQTPVLHSNSEIANIIQEGNAVRKLDQVSEVSKLEAKFEELNLKSNEAEATKLAIDNIETQLLNNALDNSIKKNLTEQLGKLKQKNQEPIYNTVTPSAARQAIINQIANERNKLGTDQLVNMQLLKNLERQLVEIDVPIELQKSNYDPSLAMQEMQLRYNFGDITIKEKTQNEWVAINKAKTETYLDKLDKQISPEFRAVTERNKKIKEAEASFKDKLNTPITQEELNGTIFKNIPIRNLQRIIDPNTLKTTIQTLQFNKHDLPDIKGSDPALYALLKKASKPIENDNTTIPPIGIENENKENKRTRVNPLYSPVRTPNVTNTP